jgi:hypothetical protein
VVGHVITRDFRVATIEKYFSRDPDVPGGWAKMGLFERLIPHIQMADAFGWEAYDEVVGSYYGAGPELWKQSDADRCAEFVVRFSKVVERNLIPFFRGWGLEVSDWADEQVAELPAWMPEPEV